MKANIKRRLEDKLWRFSNSPNVLKGTVSPHLFRKDTEHWRQAQRQVGMEELRDAVLVCFAKGIDTDDKFKLRNRGDTVLTCFAKGLSLRDKLELRNFETAQSSGHLTCSLISTFLLQCSNICPAAFAREHPSNRTDAVVL